ncbi:uncharacterized protein Dwil_GK12362 [Drosophila willistoni]|uniref:MSP domain-containing protein n=1 Tax=Drosophila willistoni TaxID=7260 RepID=B4N6Q8_DROWI|nr:uncharacterized protein LOC6646384 [Drosophila willistoni]EDW80047.1 uncharacterized protein Dwil_GK12362 [Drosophila willistoni]
MEQNLIQVSPADSLIFSSQITTPILVVTNTVNKPVTFKLQSTVFDKFKISPRRGILNPYERIEVRVSLIRQSSIISKKGRDRILVLCMLTPSSAMEVETTSCFWRHNICYNPSVEKHQIYCRQMVETEDEPHESGLAIKQQGSQ